jgi:fatty acid desaturase
MMLVVSETGAAPYATASAPEPATHRPTPAWLLQAREIASSHYRRSPAVYWTDFLASTLAGWALAAVYFAAPAWSWLQLGALLGAAILFFRTGTFIHELVHMQRGQMVWFGRAWNLLVGIPFLMPWILYRNHVDHHNGQHFGTPRDGEYLPLAASPVREIFKYLAQAPLLPLLMLIRLGVLGPVSWLHRGLREWVLIHASAAVSNPHYRKRFPQRDEAHLRIVEALGFAYLVTIGVLVATGWITGWHLVMAYVLLACALALNWIRNLVAHRYANRGDPISHLDQLGDSLNITGQTWLTMIMFPVGLRYHALHHLFPSLPYHNLGKVHRRLTEVLPPDAPYHASARASYFAAFAELWRSARVTPQEHSAMRRWVDKRGES